MICTQKNLQPSVISLQKNIALYNTSIKKKIKFFLIADSCKLIADTLIFYRPGVAKKMALVVDLMVPVSYLQVPSDLQV